MDIKLIEELVLEFRDALEIVVKEKLYGRLRVFMTFPDECCSYTSDLLVEYLMENDISVERIKIIEGEIRENGYTHCWLLVDNQYFVDITADQFNKKIYFNRYKPIPKCCVVPCDSKYLYNCFDIKKKRGINEI